MEKRKEKREKRKDPTLRTQRIRLNPRIGSSGEEEII